MEGGKYRRDRTAKPKTIKVKYLQFRKQKAANPAISKSVALWPNNANCKRSWVFFCNKYLFVYIKSVCTRRMRWAGHVASMVEERGAYRILVGKPEGKRPLGRPRRRWVDNIRMDLQEVGCGYMDWIGLAEDRDRWRTLVSAVMNLRVPWNAGNFLTSCKPVSYSRRTLHHGVSKLRHSLVTARTPHVTHTAQTFWQTRDLVPTLPPPLPHINSPCIFYITA